MIRIIFKENGQVKQLYFNSYDEYESWFEDHENIELMNLVSIKTVSKPSISLIQAF